MSSPSSAVVGDLTAVVARRVVPVVVIRDAAHTDPLADALVGGGLPVAEVTLRTDAALEAIRRLADRGDVLVGAGTVARPEQVDAAVAAGATFLVSPGLSAPVVERARAHGVPVVPGVITPTEVMAALDLGLSTLKFFPAGQFGGAATLRALAGPFAEVAFVPTGGVSDANLADYLALPNVPAVGGSWMVAPTLLAEGAWDRVRSLTADAVAAARALTPTP